MAKRRKIIKAGRIVYGIIYSAATSREPKHVRAAKTKCSSKARQLINFKQACKKLEIQIATNFSLKDLHLVLTYDNEHIPFDRESAVKILKKFLVKFRTLRRERGRELLYIYVTEDKHGDGRVHHHLIINGTGKDIEDIKKCWTFGSVNLENLDIYGYEGLAKYLTKEPRELGKSPYKRIWVSSLNLKKPEVESCWVDDSVDLVVPAGCIGLENRYERNEFGEYSYIKYMIPDYAPRKCRPSRKKE